MGETKYTRAASELMRLLQVVSSENNRTAAEVNRQAERLEGVRRDRSAEDAARFDQVMADSAVMFEQYAQGLQSTIPDFQENIATVKEGSDIHIKSEIDLNTEEGRAELAATHREAKGLLETFQDNLTKLGVLRSIVASLHQRDDDPHLKRATALALAAIDGIIAVHRDFETFALGLQFTADEKS